MLASLVPCMALAGNVSFYGYKINMPEWRSTNVAKTLVLGPDYTTTADDPDWVFGTDGWLLPSVVNDIYLPSYVRASDITAPGTAVFASDTYAADIDDPTEPPGPNVADLPAAFRQIAYQSTTAGAEANLYNIPLSGAVPSSFLLGIAFGNYAAGVSEGAASFRVALNETAGTSQIPAIAYDGLLDWIFFRVDGAVAGDVINLYGTARTTGSIFQADLAAISFDPLIAAQELPTLRIAKAGNNVRLAWPSSSSSYFLESSTTLASDSFAAAGLPVDVVGAEFVAEEPIIPAGKKFYRLASTMQNMTLLQEIARNAEWADTVFARPTASTPAAVTVRVIHEDSPGDTKAGLAAAGTPIRLGGNVYQHGIGTNSNAALRVTLPAAAVSLQAVFGIDENAAGTPATAGLRVVSGGVSLLDSGTLTANDAPRTLDLPLAGVTSFDLVIHDGGDGRSYDQMSFGDLRVIMADGKTVWLDEALKDTAGAIPTGLPFSFTYGGWHSSEFLASWDYGMTEEEPDAARRVRTITLRDPATKLEIRAVVTSFRDQPGTDWTLHFTNRGTADTPLIENLQALDVGMEMPATATREQDYLGLSLRPLDAAAAGQPVLSRLRGTLGGLERLDEFFPITDPLPVGARLTWAPPTAVPAFDAFPFFTLDWGNAGCITAIGWTGQWTASVARPRDALRLSAGLKNLRTVLRPGESIRSPRVLQMFWQGGDTAYGQNLFRQTMFSHILPRRSGKTVFPPLAHTSSSWYETNGTTEVIEKTYIDSFSPVGFETYWLDAWWFEGGHPAGIGNWGFPIDRVVAKQRFPGGPKVVADYARAKGLDFVLWFAPEYVSPGALLGQEHPEWMLPPGATAGVVNLGLPSARDFLINYNNAAIQEYGVNWWRTDNHPDLSHWNSGDTDPMRLGMTEMRYVEGFYGLWDGMLDANPGLVIDNCALGGTRIDLETASRSVVLWRSDSVVPPLWNRRDYHVNAIQGQVMNFALNRYVPLTQSGSMGTSPYLIRSAFNGGLSFGEDTRPDAYPRSQLAEGLAECKRLRKFLLGDLHPLHMPSAAPEEWCAYQYHRPAENDGCVFIFRRHLAPATSLVLKLRGLDPAATYLVTESHGYSQGEPRRLSGDELQAYSAQIPDMPGSLLLEYQREP